MVSPVCETYEPGATGAGAVVRELLLHGDDAIAPVTEALLMAADRAQHVAEIVVPALERGEWVVSDRYLPSSLVYQGVVRGLGVDTVRTMNGAAITGASPDLVVVLTVPEEQARARRRTTPDRLEAEGGDFHDAVAQAYLKLAGDGGLGAWSTAPATSTPSPRVSAPCSSRCWQDDRRYGGSARAAPDGTGSSDRTGPLRCCGARRSVPRTRTSSLDRAAPVWRRRRVASRRR